MEEIGTDYIAFTQMPDFDRNPEYLNLDSRENFIQKINSGYLEHISWMQLKVFKKESPKEKIAFFEMATGTGKTLTSTAIIKMFLVFFRSNEFFLVDRVELETQAEKEFNEILSNDFRTVVWKETQSIGQRQR